MRIDTFDTEGVLVMVNIHRLNEYFTGREFNYDYPAGLTELIEQGIIHIITTEETVENLHFGFDKNEVDPREWEYYDSYNYLKVEPGEVTRLFSHGVFTRLCHNHHGNFNEYLESSLKIRKLLRPDAGISIQNLADESPVIDIPAGLHQVHVYSNKMMNPNLLVEFFIVFESLSSIDQGKITTEPLEIFG